jgi:hypothetical protein
MATPPTLTVLVYDPRECARTEELRRACSEFVTEQSYVSWLKADTPEEMDRWFGTNDPAIIYVNGAAKGADRVLRVLAKRQDGRNRPLFVISKQRSLDTLLASVTEEPLTLSQFDARHIRTDSGYLQDELLPAFTRELRNAVAHAVAPEDVGALLETLQDNGIIDRPQMVYLGISTWRRAYEARKSLERQEQPQQQTDKIAGDIARDESLAGTLIKHALKGDDPQSGIVAFRSQASEGGGVRVWRVFLKNRTKAGAKHLADTFRIIQQQAPMLHVPSPPSDSEDYPVIDVGEDACIIAFEHLEGPTYQDLLVERNNLLDSGAGKEKISVANTYCDCLMQTALQNLAIFEQIRLPSNPPVCTAAVRREVFELYRNRVMRWAAHIPKHGLPDRTHGHADLLVEALRAMDPDDYTRIPGRHLIINDDSLVNNRDCVTLNMSVHYELRSGCEPPYLEHILNDITHPPRASRTRLENLRRPETVKAEIMKYLRKTTGNYDIGFRGNPAIRDEDWAMLVLDPAFRLDRLETLASPLPQSMEERLAVNFHKYLVYEVMAREDPNFVYDEETDSGIIIEGRNVLHALDDQGVTLPPPSLLRNIFGTRAAVLCRRYLQKYNGRDPDKWRYHMLWMRYYRAMRAASHALEDWKFPDKPDDYRMTLVRHYLFQSVAAVDFMRRELFHGLAADERPWDAEMRYVPACDFSPSHVNRVFDRMHHARPLTQNADLKPREKALIHVQRLDCLLALSKHYLSCLGWGDDHD